MRVVKWGLIVAAAGATLAALMNWPGTDGKEMRQAGPSPSAVPLRVPSIAQPGAKPAAPSSLPEEVSLSRKIQELVATQDPEKLFAAYGLLADCAEFNKEHDRFIFDMELLRKPAQADSVTGLRRMSEQEKQRDARLCGGMTERERQSRLDYLAAAAKAGVPGAAVAFIREGPFGDPSALETRAGDPLVQEWKAVAKAQLIDEAEKGSDLGAINYLAAEEMAGSALIEKNGLLAYRYLIATGLIQAEIFGADSDIAKFYAQEGPLLNGIGQDLSPQERAAEAAAAQQIARRFHDWRKTARAAAGHS